VSATADAIAEDIMQLHPSTAFEAELAYRRERIAADFERTGGRPRRSRTGGSDRRRWHRRPDRTTT
jgi:hypothetical protein